VLAGFEQAGAVYILRGEEIRASAGASEIVDRGDIRVRQPREALELGLEAPHAALCHELGMQRLERRYASVVEPVAGAVNHAHAAFAEFFLDSVAVVDYAPGQGVLLLVQCHVNFRS
jgi:hypothetical protein